MEGIRLWLFDIDGTLVDTGGAGMRALKEAAIETDSGLYATGHSHTISSTP